MEELEQDLPELKYYSLKDSDLSGKAISLLLAGAVDRANEARENLLGGLKRLDEMALTIGRFWNLFPSNIGTFENGDFDHEITVDELFSDDLNDRATTLKSLVESGVPLLFAMEQVGFTEEEIALAKEELDQVQLQRQQNLAQSLTNFNQL
jgi:hypothetical protein